MKSYKLNLTFLKLNLTFFKLKWKFCSSVRNLYYGLKVIEKRSYCSIAENYDKIMMHKKVRACYEQKVNVVVKNLQQTVTFFFLNS